MTAIATRPTPKTGKNPLKTLTKNYQNNLNSDYTEKMQSFARDFQYHQNKEVYWSDPQFSLFFGTPLYEQSSPTQKLALNHLLWTLFYKIIADSEIEVTHYNLITAGTLLAGNPEYQIIAEQLKHETEQERVHIHSFYQVGYKTQKILLGKPKNSNQGKNRQHIFKGENRENPIYSIVEKLLPKQGQYKSTYFQELSAKNVSFVTPTQGFFNGFKGKMPRFLLELLVRHWGGSPFLACNFYGVRYLANLALKNYEYQIVTYYKKRQKQGDIVPIPSAISHSHFLDEAFHTTTSLFIGRDLYQQFFLPSKYEKLVANLAFYFIQRENFSELSAILPNQFTTHPSLLSYAYQILQSPVFEFSSREAIHWLETCLCQEHEGFHTNLKLHQNLLHDFRHFASKLDYLWSINREMRLMAAGGSIPKAIAQNQKVFQQFAQSL
ncbi:MAG: hypothetical protein AB4290_04030 [Spirulina sp.]